MLSVEYARVFPWKTFTFIDYGKDHRREEWRKLSRVAKDDIYSAVPTDRYYSNRLGKRTAEPKKGGAKKDK